MKKVLLLFLIFIIAALSGCSLAKIDANNPYVHQYELIEQHKYNKDITVSIPLSNDKYEMDVPYFGETFIRQLDIDAYVKKIIVKDNEKWIRKNTDSKTIIISSKMNSENDKFYINRDGTVISLVNDNLYISEKGLIDYSDIINYHTDAEFKYFMTDQNMKEYNSVFTKIAFTIYENGLYKFGSSNNGVFYFNCVDNEIVLSESYINSISANLKKSLAEKLITQEEYTAKKEELFEECLNAYQTCLYQQRYRDLIVKKDVTMVAVPKNIETNERKSTLNVESFKKNHDLLICFGDGNSWYLVKKDDYYVCWTYKTDFYVICEPNYINVEVINTLSNLNDVELNRKIDSFRKNMEEVWARKF